MSNTPVTPTPDQMQPPAGTPPTGTPPTQAPSGVGSAITGQPAGQPPTAQPNAAQPIPTTVAGQPNQPNAAQPAPDPHEVQGGMFTKILRGLTPPTRYIDPSGNVQEMPQTKTSMGKTIVAAVLSGMFTKNSYHEGAYGPVLDRQATAADAFNAGQGVVAKQNAAAQKLSDDQQAKKLSYAAANLASMQNYAALEHTRFAAEKEGTEAEKAQSEFLQKQADQNNLTLGASADAYDQALTDKDAPKARLAQKATMDELLSGPFKSKMMQQLMVQDGTRSVYSEATGRTHTVPTYSLYNPDVELKLNKDAVDRAAKINPSFQGMYEVTGGNVPLNLARYAQITHQINSVDHAEDTLQSLSDSQDALAKNLGITGNVEGRLAAVVKGNPSAMKSLLEFENATAHGGNSADQLQRLLQSDGGDAIFKALGTNRDKVTDYIEAYNNRLVSARKLAAEGGLGDKSPAPQQMIADLQASAKTLTNAQQKTIMAGFNPNGTTVGQAKALREDILKAQNENTERQSKDAENADKHNDTMIATGINPQTKERLSLNNAPDEALVDIRTGNPIPTKFLTTLKPTMQESNRSDFAKSAIHSLDELNDLINSSEAKFGPIVGPVDKWMAGHGLGEQFQQKALNYLTFAQSAATGAHVGGRFNVPIMDKMGTTVSVNMGPDQLKGATDSIKDVMQQYVDQGGRFTVAQYKALPQSERDRLQGKAQPRVETSSRVVPAGKIPVVVSGRTVGYADDKKGTNYIAF